MLHLVLHVLVPLLVARLAFRRYWRFAFAVMLGTMLVDIDHLLADPIYDPQRCSIGFHPLHKIELLPVYGVLALIPKTRLIGLGLVIHMALDALDCQLNVGRWFF